MSTVDDAIREIETIAGRDVQGRNIGPLLEVTLGNLARAARSILSVEHPSVALITGFYIAHGAPPNCETDGPPGTVMLAAGLRAVGVPVRLCTDSVSERVLRATLAAAPSAAGTPVDVVPVPAAADPTGPIGALEARWQAERVSHVIAVERCGPAADGRARNARGDDMSRHNAPLERLFAARGWTSIAVGDLGNEVGMGSLPGDLVARSVPNGARIWCPVPCDIPIVSGIANWSGASLLAALALLRPEWGPCLCEHLHARVARGLLEAAVRDGGAVSGDRTGTPPYPCLFVDEVPWSDQEPTFVAIHERCTRALAATRPAGAAGS